MALLANQKSVPFRPNQLDRQVYSGGSIRRVLTGVAPDQGHNRQVQMAVHFIPCTVNAVSRFHLEGHITLILEESTNPAILPSSPIAWLAEWRR